jgi:isopentenyldiphosphate isomerase
LASLRYGWPLALPLRLKPWLSLPSAKLNPVYTNPDELFDVLDEFGIPTGETKPRALVHRDGDWHRSFHLWIVKDGTHVLFQRRSHKKDLEANKLDVTVGGHFGAGETLLEVVREVEEEIGLKVQLKDLHFIETRQGERHYENAVDREFVDVYALRCDQKLDAYYLQCDEVSVLYEVPIDKAIELYRDGTFVAVYGYDCQQRTNNALLVSDDLIEGSGAEVVETLLKVKGWLEVESAEQRSEG